MFVFMSLLKQTCCVSSSKQQNEIVTNFAEINLNIICVLRCMCFFQVKDILSKVKNNHVGKSLLTKPLNSDQVVKKSFSISFQYLTKWSK